MNSIKLELSGISTIEELHVRLQESFCLPEHYGRNLDALWDCLYCGFSEATVISVSGSPAPELREKTSALIDLLRDLAQQDDRVALIIDDELIV